MIGEAPTIRRIWCPDCEATGHQSGCSCSSEEFVVGCCDTCGGEGLIPEPLPPGTVLGPDGKPIRKEAP